MGLEPGIEGFKHRLPDYLRETQRVATNRDTTYTLFSGGIPRMTFAAVRWVPCEGKRYKKPIIVLGWTAPLWHNRNLRRWAPQCRERDFEKFDTTGRRLQAIKSCRQDAVAQLERRAEEWEAAKLAKTIQTFRTDHGFSDHGVGDSGIAIAFPGSKSCARCANCFCSTGFCVKAETLELLTTVQTECSLKTLKTWLISCAEIEAVLAGIDCPLPLPHLC